MRWWLAALLASASLAGAQPGDGAAPRRSLEPAVEPARGGQCVADPSVMRRDHMSMLKHQRDQTVRAGVRGAPVSLKGCVECHASKATGSVAASRSDFCVSCHSYAAVKIVCFECHASRPVRRTGTMAASRAERRAAPTPARILSGDRPTYPSDEGRS